MAFSHRRQFVRISMSGLRILPILIVLLPWQQARAVEKSAITPGANMEGAGTARDGARWVAPTPAGAKAINERRAQPAKVRIGLRLTPFRQVVTQDRNGRSVEHSMPLEALRYTLRARLNKVNHFFVGKWHIETTPEQWVRTTRHYVVKLDIYRRYGAFGQLEENVGSLQLRGVLDEGENNVHVLLGVARVRLRDKFGRPVLDVVAGFAPGAQAKAPALSLRRREAPPPKAPVKPPKDYSGELLRGRF